MEKKEDYEKLYDMLLGYEQEIHKKNQKRIRIGLRCLIIIPLILLTKTPTTILNMGRISSFVSFSNDGITNPNN